MRTTPLIIAVAIGVLGAGHALAQNKLNSGRPSAVLNAERCGELWKLAVPEGDKLAMANAGPFIVNFQQVDADADGNLTEIEFRAACGKGMVKDTGQQ